jgi:hypothetical protein
MKEFYFFGAENLRPRSEKKRKFQEWLRAVAEEKKKTWK